jgi:hypothetical protein
MTIAIDTLALAAIVITVKNIGAFSVLPRRTLAGATS